MGPTAAVGSKSSEQILHLIYSLNVHLHVYLAVRDPALNHQIFNTPPRLEMKSNYDVKLSLNLILSPGVPEENLETRPFLLPCSSQPSGLPAVLHSNCI